MQHGRGLSLIALLGLSMGAAIAHAQTLGGARGPYVGVAIGSIDYQQANDEDPLGIGLSYADRHSAYRLFAGYRLTSVYSIELGWAKAGEFKARFLGTSPGLGVFLIDESSTYRISSLRMLAFAPIGSLRMFGGIGYFHAKLETELTGVSIPIAKTVSHTSGGAMLLGGLQYDMRRFSFRGAYEWYHTKNLPGITSVNLAVMYKF